MAIKTNIMHDVTCILISNIHIRAILTFFPFNMWRKVSRVWADYSTFPGSEGHKPHVFSHLWNIDLIQIWQ
jgi:hypothetical protein